MTADFVVETDRGRVRGLAMGAAGAVFAGIPFAGPPVGPLRLRPPQPVESWSGVRDAVRFPPRPAQSGFAGQQIDMGPSVGVTAEGLETNPQSSEDCLYLNVWSPGLSGRRPVIVWIYGGGYEVGAASPPDTNGASLAQRADIVVVAMNYRVGALGFLHLVDLGGPEWAGSTNLGLQDQAAALHWVKENIAAFGGDPDNVTIAGQSAGAFSVGSLLAMPIAAGTFGKAILSSGSTSRIFHTDIANVIAEDVLSKLGLSTVDELLDVPVERILAIQSSVVDNDLGLRNLPGGRSWGAVLDGTLLPRRPQDAVKDGVAVDIPLLVSANRDEMRLFQLMQGEAYHPDDEDALLAEITRAGFTQPAQVLAAYRKRAPAADLTQLRTLFLGDAIYRMPVSRLAQAQVAAGGRAYAALFSAEPMGPEIGAGHGMDLPYVFDQLTAMQADTPENLAIRDEMVGTWARFAATGDPGWPAYTHANARQFGGDAATVTEPPDDEATALWRGLG
jgi:para-nitrobenzyl esterase